MIPSASAEGDEPALGSSGSGPGLVEEGVGGRVAGLAPALEASASGHLDLAYPPGKFFDLFGGQLFSVLGLGKAIPVGIVGGEFRHERQDVAFTINQPRAFRESLFVSNRPWRSRRRREGLGRLFWRAQWPHPSTARPGPCPASDPARRCG